MTSTVGRLVVSVLTNKRGSGVSYGDVVYIDTGNADAFTVGTTGAYTGMVGICIEKNGIANNATGRIQTQGLCAQVNLSASGTLGHYIKTHTVAAQAVDAGASRVLGAFGQILTGSTATPDVLLFGFPDAASSSASAGTPGLTLSTTNSAGAASTFVATDATVAVFDATVPAANGVAAAGSAGTAARRDHVHPSTGLLAITSYTAAGDNTYVITTGSDADVDATNLKVIFTAPASGNILVRLSAFYNDSTSGNCNFHWTVREATTTLGDNYISSGLAKAVRGHAEFYITGISGGSHTYKFGAYQASGTNATIYYGNSTSKFGPVVMEVWGAP